MMQLSPDTRLDGWDGCSGYHYSNEYIIGTPLFEKATINLENGNHFTILAENLSEDSVYIDSAMLNGESLHRNLFHEEIMEGGILIFKMTHTPSEWGTYNKNLPKTEILDLPITLAPFIAKGDIAFKDKTEVVLGVAPSAVEIFYSINI